MKVLLIDVNYKTSSTGKLVHSIASYLKKQGAEVVVAYGRGQETDDRNVYKFSFDLETKLHAILTRITGLTGCFSFFSTLRLLSIIKREKPDVIHINELHGYFVNYLSVLKYISQKNTPILWTFHCEFMYTGRCGIADKCDRYLHGCGKCSRLHAYPRTMFFDFSKHMLKQKMKVMESIKKMVICSPSKWLDSRVATSYLKNREHYVVYNGIDTDVFHPYNNIEEIRLQYGLVGKKVIISVASDILKRTGTNIIELAKTLPEYIFVMVGVIGELQDKPNNLLTFAPTDDQVWLAKMYSLSDLYLICSKRETFSMPCAEALCCGTPVVGFKAGAPEATFEEPFAKFCDYGDIQHLKMLIQENFKSPISSQECASYGIVKFSNETMCNEYSKYYKTLLER